MEKLICARDAAKKLGVSRTTLTKYTKTGILPHVKSGRAVKYPLEAVEELKRDRDQGFSTDNLRGEVATLKYRLNKMERLMRFIMFKLELQNIPVEFSEKDLLFAYDMAKNTPAGDTAKAYKWMEIALTLSENEYSRLSALTGDPYPWRPFFNYADQLIAKIKNKRGYRSNPELQQLAQDIGLCQQEIRKCGLVMLTTEPAKMHATKRFDILVTEESGEIDPHEMVAELKDPRKMSEKDLKKANSLQSVSGVGPKGPRGDAR
jgi:excisionase family DNA binding protein